MKRILHRFGLWLVRRTTPKHQPPAIIMDARSIARVVWKDWDDKAARR